MRFHFNYSSNLTKLIIIAEFCLVAYLLYSLTSNVYQSYQIDRYISQFEEENFRIAVENAQRSEDYAYYTSEQYVDKIAKQNLGLVNSGEEVIVIAPEDKLIAENEAEAMEEARELSIYALSNPQKWWKFLTEN
ncbi:MAG: septum formation initiator family protein [Patescibacteria group bacterium]|nr:septum formation initiator family protein [Patescibacteria group bacterium]